MPKTSNFLNSSVGRKLIVALSGLFLCSFLIVHLYINLFLFKQDEGKTFDVYSEFMATYPLIRPLEWVLFLGFIVHAVVAVWLWFINRQVRPQKYAVYKGSDTSELPSRITFITGTFVFIFLVVHINTFFVRSRFFPDGRTMYEIVAQAFKNPWYDAFYIVALVFVAYHLKHGIQSMCQTLGIRNERYLLLINIAGVFFWLIIPLAFAAMPLYFLWAH